MRSPGLASTGVKGFIEVAIDAVARSESELAALQDSLMPIEYGDTDLRAGLTEVRELIGGFSQHARGVRAHLRPVGATISAGGHVHRRRVDTRRIRIPTRRADEGSAPQTGPIRANPPRGGDAKPEVSPERETAEPPAVTTRRSL